jgi:hypothetical protein
MSKYEMLETNKKMIAEKFDEYKNNLKVFSEQNVKDVKLSKVEAEEWWNIIHGCNHVVTGEELNKLSSQIQDHLISINDIKNRIIKEFGVIYNTFNALDNEYIKNITHSMMKSNEAINKANKGLIEAEKRIEDIKEVNGKIQITQKNIKFIQEKLQVSQQDIGRKLEIIKNVLEDLSLFKAKVDSHKHLKDVDNIWDDLKKLESKILAISEDIKEVKMYIQRNVEELNSTKISKDKSENYTIDEDTELKLKKLKRTVLISNISFGIITILLFSLFFMGSK